MTKLYTVIAEREIYLFHFTIQLFSVKIAILKLEWAKKKN